jgi:hypothetical protein
MSQYDWGVIDPYVVDGVQLAGMLNQWRDAIDSWHRGPARPPYVVPGMMWVDDSAGAANWLVYVYMGATVGDRPFLRYDTTTGTIDFVGATGGTFVAQILHAQAAAGPAVWWTSDNNPIDNKRWRATTMGTGALRFGAYTDVGVETAWIQFNRDGTISRGPDQRFRVVSSGAGNLALNGINWTALFRNEMTPIVLYDDTGVIKTAGTTPTYRQLQPTTPAQAGRWEVWCSAYITVGVTQPSAAQAGCSLVQTRAGARIDGVQATGVLSNAFADANTFFCHGIFDVPMGDLVECIWANYSAGGSQIWAVGGGPSPVNGMPLLEWWGRRLQA